MIPCLYLQAERGNQTKTERKVIHISCFFFFLNQIHNTREMQSLKLIGGGGGVLFSRLYSNLQGKEKNLCKEIMSSKDVNFP